jgi:hypothetical protein
MNKRMAKLLAWHAKLEKAPKESPEDVAAAEQASGSVAK